MKNTIIFTLFLFCSFSLNSQIDTSNIPIWQSMMQDRNVNYFKTLSAYNKFYQNRTKEKQTGWKVFERWAHHASLIINPDGSFPPANHVIKEYNKFLRNKVSTRSGSGAWTEIGPVGNPQSTPTDYGIGRVSAIAFHPTNINTIYLGAPQGGFWVSTDKGQTWTSSTDNMPTLGVSAIVALPSIPPTNPPLILIGTGDRDAFDAAGLGVYKSTDGGVTFTASNSGIANSGNVTVNKLMVNPLNLNTIVAATSGGVYFSYNKGNNWTLKSPNVNMKDIQYKPGDTSTLYASNGGTFYRTINAGNNWQTINSGLSTPSSINRIAIGVTAANPNIVYLVASKSSDNTLEGFYKSSNSGVNFTKSTNTTNILGGDLNGGPRGQGWYDLAIETSPTDSNIVLVGGINIFRSTNGGTNWNCVAHWWGQNGTKYVHADIHVFNRHPITQEIFIGSDGGIDFTSNNGTTYTNINGTLAIRQFYHLDVARQSPLRILAGAQDNGTILKRGNAWKNMTGGDGMMPKISPLDSNILISSSQNGNLNYSVNGGNNWDYSINWDNVNNVTKISDAGPWVTPFAFHPTIPEFMIALYKNAWRTTDLNFGDACTFEKITTNITNDGTAISFSNVSPNLCFIANGSQLRRSNNIISLSPSWTSLTPLGSGTITSIATSYRDSNILFITRGIEVYKSTDAGITWQIISNNLPNIKMFSVVLDKYSDDRLYVGTEAGTYVKDNGATNWNLFNTGLPVNSEIRELNIWYDTACSNNSKITAATYGRGAWQSDLLTTNNPVVDFSVPASSCAGLPVNFTNNTTNSPDSFKWTVTGPGTVTYLSGTNNKSANPQVSFSTPGSYSIELYAKKNNFGYCSLKKTNIISINNAGNLTLNFGDTTICPLDSVKYVASGATNYSWSPAIGLSADTGKNVTVSPIANTTYKVISNINGNCFDTATFNIVLKPTVNLSVQGNRKLCQGDTSTILVSGADTYLWTPNTFLSSDTARSVRCFTNSDITYSIKGSSSGLCSNTINFLINSQTRPTFTYSKNPDTFLCSNVSFETEYQGNLTSYLINPEMGLTRNGDNLKFENTTTQKYVLSFQDTQFCPIFDTFTVQRKVKPNVVVSGIKSLCVGDSTVLSASGADTFIWTPSTFLDKNLGNNVRSKPSSTIEYTVIGKIESCIDSAKHTITVGTQNVNLIISGDSSLCENNRTRLVASGALNYSWSPAQFVDNPNSASVFVKSQNPVTLTVTGTIFGCVGQASKSLTVGQTPEIEYTIEKGGLQICKGDTVQIKLNPELQYNIEPLYNYKFVNDSQYIFFPRDITKYTIYAKGPNSCTNSEDLEILVENRPTVTINPGPTTIFRGDSIYLLAEGAVSYVWKSSLAPISNPNVQGFWAKPNNTNVYQVEGATAFGCKSDASTVIYVVRNTNPTNGIDDLLSQVQFYPNPVQNQLQIESSEPLQFILRTIEGRDIIQANINKGKNYIDFSNITQGIYVAWFIKDQEHFKIEKINVIK